MIADITLLLIAVNPPHSAC